MGKLLANKEEIKYSIIVPMYNVEKYIEECISSVINQINGFAMIQDI